MLRKITGEGLPLCVLLRKSDSQISILDVKAPSTGLSSQKCVKSDPTKVSNKIGLL